MTLKIEALHSSETSVASIWIQYITPQDIVLSIMKEFKITWQKLTYIYMEKLKENTEDALKN